jgi:hypothetical protein
MHRFLQLFGGFVDFTYGVWDRIVLRGYYERLQRPANIVYFFRDVCGIYPITPEVLASRTQHYRKWLDGYAAQRGIPILSAPKGARKEDFVLPFHRRFRGDEGVVVILKSLEKSRTFVSYEPRYLPPSGEDYRQIRNALGKNFLHYYFYVVDPVMGPMCLRVASYLPFSVNCYFNGHSFLAQQLRRRGIRFRKDDNAIVGCEQPEVLSELATTLDAKTLRERADHWAFRLAPSFSVSQRQACQLHYQWSVAQIEFCENILFKRRAPLRALFQRATEIGVALGGATQVRHIFGRRLNRRYTGKLESVLERRDEGFAVLRAYYKTSFVKQYEKGDRLLRTEACLNDPKHLDVGRRLENLPALEDKLRTTTDRYLEQQAELLDSTVDTGALAKLAKPIQRARRRVPGIKLNDDRLLRLVETLLYTGTLLGDWTTRDLLKRICERHRICEEDYRLGQLRYDLSKLRAHGLVTRVEKRNRYRLTHQGVRLAAVLVKTRTRLLGPLVSIAVSKRTARSNHPSKVEAALRKVDKALDGLCDSLGLRAAG